MGAYGRKPWGQQKPPLGYQLDRSSPFARDLVGCWLFNEGAGSLAGDIANGKNATTSATAIIDSFGVKGSINTANVTTPAIGLVMPSFSVCWQTIITLTGVYANSVVLSNIWGYFVWHMGELDTSVYCGTTLDNRWESVDIPNGTIKLNVKQTWVYTNFNSSARLYLDGKLIAGPKTQQASTLVVPGLYMGPTGIWGYFINAYLYSRALSAAEVSYLYANPYAMVEGYNMGRFFSITGAANIVFSPIWYGNTSIGAV
jgi:hypothetical protein